MATKAQKRAAAEAKHNAYVAQEKADGLKALADERAARDLREAMIAEKAVAFNRRSREIVEAGLKQLGEDHPTVIEYRRQMEFSLGMFGVRANIQEQTLESVEAPGVPPMRLEDLTVGDFFDKVRAFHTQLGLEIAGEAIGRATKATQEFTAAFNAPIPVKPDPRLTQPMYAIQRIKAAADRKKKAPDQKPMIFESPFEKSWPDAPDYDEDAPLYPMSDQEKRDREVTFSNGWTTTKPSPRMADFTGRTKLLREQARGLIDSNDKDREILEGTDLSSALRSLIAAKKDI